MITQYLEGREDINFKNVEDLTVIRSVTKHDDVALCAKFICAETKSQEDPYSTIYIDVWEVLAFVNNNVHKNTKRRSAHVYRDGVIN